MAVQTKCLGHKAGPVLEALHEEERRKGQHGETTIPHLHAVPNLCRQHALKISPCQTETETLSTKICILLVEPIHTPNTTAIA